MSPDIEIHIVKDGKNKVIVAHSEIIGDRMKSIGNHGEHVNVEVPEEWDFDDFSKSFHYLVDYAYEDMLDFRKMTHEDS